MKRDSYMSNELLGLAAFVNILGRAAVAKGLLSKDDLLAELSRVRRSLPDEVAQDLQELILQLPDQ